MAAKKKPNLLLIHEQLRQGTKQLAQQLVHNIAREEESEEVKKRRANDECWEKAEDKLRITIHSARQRAKAIRAELELYREQVEAIPFDIASGDLGPPYCLDTNIRRRYVLELVEDLNPFVAGFFQLIDDFAEKHGTHEYLDFNSKLHALKHEAATTGFQIGVLAGVMFSGRPKETVDTFERGLAFAMSSRVPVKRSRE